MPGTWRRILLESTGSTNDFLKEGLLGLSDRTVVRAVRQTSGKGRLGRTWESPPGGLYASILLVPPPSPEHASRVALLIADIICGELLRAGIGACVKWPNDVIAGDGKIAGILPEYGTFPVPWFVTGMGVNLAAAPSIPGRNGPPPAAWARFAPPPDPDALLDRLLLELDEAWPDRTLDPISDRAEGITGRLWMSGREVEVVRGERLDTGIVKGIDAQGRLLLSTGSGMIYLDSGELSPVRSR